MFKPPPIKDPPPAPPPPMPPTAFTDRKKKPTTGTTAIPTFLGADAAPGTGSTAGAKTLLGQG